MLRPISKRCTYSSTKVGEETKQAATKEAEAVLSKAQVQADSIVNDAIEKRVV